LLEEVRALAARLLKKGKAIDVLVNNAGALINAREETAEGLEKNFALLLLSPYLLSSLLRPLLKKAASQHGVARVVNVLSGGMYTQKIHVDDLQSRKGSYSGSVAYARAKRGLMILTEEWARRWARDGIVVNALHPGWADTRGGGGAAGVPPSHGTSIAHSATGCRHHRLAGGRHGGRQGQWRVLARSPTACEALLAQHSRNSGRAAGTAEGTRCVHPAVKSQDCQPASAYGTYHEPRFPATTARPCIHRSPSRAKIVATPAPRRRDCPDEEKTHGN